MSNLIPFEFENHSLRVVVDKSGEPWFVANDACAILEIQDVWQALQRLDEDEKGSVLIRTPGGEQKMNAVNESGLYSLIFDSRKPEAKRMRKWVTSDVLPSIRKTGSYSLSAVGTKAQPQLPATHNFWDFWKQLDSLTKEYGAARCPAHKHAIFLQMEMLRDMHGYPVDETMRRLHAQALNPPEHPLMAEFWEAYDLIGADKLNHSPDFDMIAISPADFFRMASDAGFDFNKAQVEHCLPRSLRYKYLGKKMTDSRIEPERMPVCWLFGVNT